MFEPFKHKQVNVIIEPTDDEEGSYTIPAYTYLKSNSRSVHVGLHNMSCHTVSLSKGTVVAEHPLMQNQKCWLQS